MSEKDLVEIDDLEVDALSDEDLESVAGGLAAGSCSCCQSDSGCTGGAAIER